ncbi:SLATT domain-containing protein [Aeromonas veronii]|uniref:SLATT domain-containing protein n=1 Tax=Aeromonas veronii TaxID=654 RepID=UPI001316D1DC|nr:SLATT domain-containing protein [Aeromonas veronii]QHC08406.1 SLATT domain-containing protein [Aeromonas veronii]
MIKDFLIWLFGLKINERKEKNAIEKLKMSMRATAKCRYFAASRLQRQTRFSFFTTTILSLGLIFIPLMQNSGVKLAYNANVLGMMQIFLAVSILVYSVVIATARYDVRAEKLTECGDKLKELIRAIDLEIDENKTIQDSKLRIFQDRYSDIATDTENHISSDYKFAMLEMTRDYKITGLKRLQVWLFALLQTSIPLALPAVLLLFEVAFITDMVGATNVFTTYLNGVDIINKPIH